MALSWADDQRRDKFCPSRPEEQTIITLFQNMLDKSIDPESAAHTVAATYEPRLLKGEKVSNHLFSLLSRAIIHPTTTLENHQQIVEMLLHLSKLPDVTVDGASCKENGHTYWQSIPEFSFWLSLCAFHVHAIEDMDLGNCPLTWHQQAKQYKQANTFAAIYTAALPPSITHEWKSTQHTALHCLSQALEVEISTYPQIRRAGIHVPAASAWLLHAAPQIYKFCNSQELYHGNLEWRRRIVGGDGGVCLWDGDEGFSVQRWVFWKQRFEGVEGLGRRGFAGRVIDDVVGCARQAVKVMRDVEQEEGLALDGISGLFGRHDVPSLVL